jgi:hypothetical protein
MPIVEALAIAGSVAAIISAFRDAQEMFRTWKKKRRQRNEAGRPDSYERSLDTGSSLIKRDYDSHYARLGSAFARGDGKICSFNHCDPFKHF